MGYILIVSAASAATIVVTAVILLVQAGINAQRLVDLQEQLGYLQDDVDTLIKHLGADRSSPTVFPYEEEAVENGKLWIGNGANHE